MSAHSASAPDIRNYSALSKTDQRGVLRFLTRPERKELRRRVLLVSRPQPSRGFSEIKQDLSPAFRQTLARALSQAPGASRHTLTPQARAALVKLLGASAP